MTSTTADTVPAARAPRTDSGTDTTTRTRRSRTGSDAESNGSARYFLAKTNGNDGTPALDREMTSQGEALVEALRLGVTFYMVQEFRAVPDFSGKKPLLNKEAVKGK
ncbi:MAG TPA: hypothetical protein VE779_17075 [Candidatus Angelobacter sp.]|nr:hypothetical protein [Candidatus Angelobacter sp.]